MNELYSALSKAQSQMRSAELDKVNPHFRSKYASLAAVWDAIREPLTKNGLAITQTFVAGERLTMLTRLTHASGQSLESFYPIEPMQNTPQGLASAITYARRYSIASLVGVTADDDDDGNAASPAPVDKKSEFKSAPTTAAAPAPAPVVKPVVEKPASVQVNNEAERAELFARISSAAKSGKWKAAELKVYSKAAFGVEDSKALSIAELKMLASVCENSTFGAALKEVTSNDDAAL